MIDGKKQRDRRIRTRQCPLGDDILGTNSLNAFWEMNQTACTIVTAPLHPSVLSEALCTELSY